MYTDIVHGHAYMLIHDDNVSSININHVYIRVLCRNAQQHSWLRQGAVQNPPDKANPASQDAQDLKSPRVKEISSIFLPP